MTQKDLLQAARDIMVNAKHDRISTRRSLQTAARSNGRSAEAVYKASTMRLALWATGKKSAI